MNHALQSRRERESEREGEGEGESGRDRERTLSTVTVSRAGPGPPVAAVARAMRPGESACRVGSEHLGALLGPVSRSSVEDLCG